MSASPSQRRIAQLQHFLAGAVNPAHRQLAQLQIEELECGVSLYGTLHPSSITLIEPPDERFAEAVEDDILLAAPLSEAHEPPGAGDIGIPPETPEEYESSLPCDGRADQYALGLIVYEMLTGHRVFEHKDWNVLLAMHRSQEPPSAQIVMPGLPDWVCDALARALEKEPNKRFPTCEEFAVAVGCQMLSTPVVLPVVLREARGWRLTRLWQVFMRFSFLKPHLIPRILRLTGLATPAVDLVLTPEALWVACRGEVVRWPLQALSSVKVGRAALGEVLYLCVEGSAGPTRHAFQFSKYLDEASWEECRVWHDLIDSLRREVSRDVQESAESCPVEPVLIYQKRPAVRCQLLGPFEAAGESRRQAEALLQVRAAMAGADAVVEVKLESIPEFNRTIRRLTGTAVRVADWSAPQKLVQVV
jgi:hypothetical protein